MTVDGLQYPVSGWGHPDLRRAFWEQGNGILGRMQTQKYQVKSRQKKDIIRV
jgi:hypothetical protein